MNRKVWKKRTEVAQTADVPPTRGSTILATIGSTRKRRNALANKQIVNTASTATEKVACLWSTRAAALIKSGYLGRRASSRPSRPGPSRGDEQILNRCAQFGERTAIALQPLRTRIEMELAVPAFLPCEFVQLFGGKHEAVRVEPCFSWEPTKHGEIRRGCRTKAWCRHRNPRGHVRRIHSHCLHLQSDDPPAHPVPND